MLTTIHTLNSQIVVNKNNICNITYDPDYELSSSIICGMIIYIHFNPNYKITIRLKSDKKDIKIERLNEIFENFISQLNTCDIIRILDI